MKVPAVKEGGLGVELVGVGGLVTAGCKWNRGFARWSTKIPHLLQSSALHKNPSVFTNTNRFPSTALHNSSFSTGAMRAAHLVSVTLSFAWGRGETARSYCARLKAADALGRCASLMHKGVYAPTRWG